MEVDYVRAILNGGVIAYSILGLSVVLIAVSIGFLVTLREGTLCPQELYLEVADLLERGDRQRATLLVEGDPSALARVLEAGLARAAGDRAVATEVMREAAAEETLRLAHRVAYIGLIAAVAPMMGLLGTVAGMIEAFSPSETASELFGDEEETLQKKTVTYQYMKQEERASA